MAVGNPISLTDNVASRIVSQTATESQTNFTISGGYRINAISVYRNGVRLANGRDYSAVDGSVVVLSSPSVEYDVLEFHIFDDFRVADAIVSNASHQNIDGDLTITGILTASNFSFTTLQLDSLTVTNDVSIGGTLTYQDVKNVDSVGVITARTDIHVGAGLSVVGVSTFNGNAIFNGNVNLGNASSDTITVAGKFDGDLIPSADDQKDLGSSTLEWKNLYLDGTANIDTLSVSGNSILTGSVGIGLTNPAAELHTIGDVIIQGDGGTGERSLFIGKHATITPKTRGVAVVANQTAAEHHEMILKTSTSSSGLVEQVRITSDGDVGIGSEIPAGKLDVDGHTELDNVNISGVVTATSFVGPVTGNVNGNISGTAGGLTGSPSITVTDLTASGNVSIAGTLTYEDVTNIDSVGLITARSGIHVTSGSVGIGETSPTNPLVVSQSTANINLELHSTSSGRGTQIMTHNDHATFYHGLAGDTTGEYIYYTADEKDHVFSTDATERLRITSDGKIGIGLTNPTYNLSINGTGAVRNEIVCTNNNDAGAGVYMKTLNSGSMVSNATVRTDNVGNFQIFNGTTTDAERLRIDSIGSLSAGGTILTESDLNWTHDTYQRPHIFSGDSGGNPADGVIVSASAATNPSNSRIGAFIFGCKTSSTTGVSNSGLKALIEAYTNSNVSDAWKTGGYIKFSVRPDNGNLVEKLRLTSGGLVGIGTISPTEKLEAYGTDASIIVHNTGNSRGGITALNTQRLALLTTTAGDDLVFGYSGNPISTGSFVERMRIDNGTGSVGIGTDNPGAALHVLSTAYPTATITRNHAVNYPRLRIVNTANDGADLDGLGDGTGGFRISCVAAGVSTERLRITSAGAVNIGGDYTQTAYKTQITGDLLVQKSQAAYLHPQIELYASNTGAYGGAIKFTGNFSGAKYQQALIRTYGGSNNTDGSLAFHTGDGTEKLRITSGGHVRINTGDLVVGETTDSNAGSQTISVGSITSGAGGIQLWGNPTNGNSFIQFGDATAGASHYRGFINYRHGDDGLRFGTAATDRLIIDSVGRVTIMDGTSTANYNNKLMVLGSATNTSTGTGSYVVMGVGDTNSMAEGRGGGIAFHGNDGVNTQVTLAQIQGYKENSNSGDYAGGFRIHTRVASGTVTERLRVSSQGRLHLKAVGGAGVIADFQEGTSATDSESLIAVTTGYSAGSNEGSARFGAKRTGNGNAAHFIVSTRETGSNIASGWYNRFMVKDNSLIQYNTYRAYKHSNEGGTTSLYNFRLAIDMIGSTAYTIRLRNFGNGAHHFRLMGSHWSSGYNLIKESYYYTDAYAALSETSIQNITSGAQGAWSVARPTSGQTGYQTDVIITKSAGTYGGGHTGLIDIITNRELYLVSIT